MWDNQVALGRRLKGGTTWQRIHWGTVGPEVEQSRASKTVLHKGKEIELDVLAIGDPAKGVFD